MEAKIRNRLDIVSGTLQNREHRYVAFATAVIPIKEPTINEKSASSLKEGNNASLLLDEDLLPLIRCSAITLADIRMIPISSKAPCTIVTGTPLSST